MEFEHNLCLYFTGQDADAALVRHEHNILVLLAKQLAIQNRHMAALSTTTVGYFLKFESRKAAF